MDGLRRPLLLTWSIDRGVGGLCQLAATSDILNPNLGCVPAGYGRVRYTAFPRVVRGAALGRIRPAGWTDAEPGCPLRRKWRRAGD